MIKKFLKTKWKQSDVFRSKCKTKIEAEIMNYDKPPGPHAHLWVGCLGQWGVEDENDITKEAGEGDRRVWEADKIQNLPSSRDVKRVV